MKKSLVFFVMLSVAVVFSSCDLLTGGSATELPTKIGFSVPANLTNGSATTKSLAEYDVTNAGAAYLLVKDFVEGGTSLVDKIDTILTTVGENKTLFVLLTGQKVVNPQGGEWFLFDKQASGTGYYLYFGEDESKTNFYIDFVRVDTGKFRGKTILFADDLADIDRVHVDFDNSITEPFVDVYVDYSESNATRWENLRCKLIKMGDGEVKVQAKLIMDTNVVHTAGVNNFSESWDIMAYAHSGEAGGAYAHAAGYVDFTNTVLSVDVAFRATNYLYKEFFNLDGNTTYKIATYDVYNGAAFDTLVTNDYVYDPETWTNGSEPPSGVVSVLDGMTRLDSADMPTPVLP